MVELVAAADRNKMALAVVPLGLPAATDLRAQVVQVVPELVVVVLVRL